MPRRRALSCHSASGGLDRRVRSRRGDVGQAAGAADGSGILEPHRRHLRAERDLPFRQPAVERGPFPVRHPGAGRSGQAGRRVHGRRARAEFHLHRRHQTRDRVHRRHPERESRSAPDVQGAVRAVRGPGRFRLAALLAQASVGPAADVDRRRDFFRVSAGRAEPGRVRSQPQGHPASARRQTRLRAHQRRCEGD